MLKGWDIVYCMMATIPHTVTQQHMEAYCKAGKVTDTVTVFSLCMGKAEKEITWSGKWEKIVGCVYGNILGIL